MISTLASIAILLAAEQQFGLKVDQCPAGLKPIETAVPRYPTPPSLRDYNGWVEVRFVILPSGYTKYAEAIESSSSLFERAAVQAILEFKYPAQPKMCRYQHKFSFEIE